MEELSTIIHAMIAENAETTADAARQGEPADKAFHMLIAQATRNSAIAGIVEELWTLRDRSTLTHMIYETVRDTGVRPSIDEHWAIYNALAKGDPSAARAAMHTHLSRVIETMFKATEIEAVEQAKRKVSADRARYSRRIDTA